jgi:thiamine-phosphate pyrophosphorylase
VVLPPRLIALSPGDLGSRAASGEDDRGIQLFLDRAKAAIECGLRGIMLRESGLGDRDLLSLAVQLLASLPQRDSLWLCIHDRVHLARAMDADAVHLGFRSLPALAARHVLGEDVAIGLSTHANDPIDLDPCVDYAFFGPVFSTPSKVGLLDPVGLDGLAARCRGSATPIWALGGITPEGVDAAADAGARGVAVLSGILASKDCAARTRDYLRDVS